MVGGNEARVSVWEAARIHWLILPTPHPKPPPLVASGSCRTTASDLIRHLEPNSDSYQTTLCIYDLVINR